MGELKRVVYGFLGGGFSDDFPYGSQRPTNEAGLAPFRDMQNMIWSQGALRNAWKWTALDATVYTNPTIDGNLGSRQETTATNAQSVVGGAMISTSFQSQRAYIVITDGEVFVGGLPMNPTYATGTTQQANGSYNVFGDGTAWNERGIKPGDLIKNQDPDVDNEWQVITEVPYDELVRVATTVSGSMGGGLLYPYTIRRTFLRGVIPGKVSWAILNGDLYVACQGAGIDPSGLTSGWCVLKVADVFGTPVEATYILSTWDVTGSIPARSIVDSIDEIVGLQATADGRIVLATNEDGLGNRIRWCSFRDVTDWTGEEAGFTDLATGTADIKCLSRIGETLVAYFADSIHIGVPTHQQHLPYTWQKVPAARMGTRWYRGACESKHGNLVVGSDGHFYIFDGNEMIQLTDNTIRKYTSGPDQVYLTGETVSGEIATATWSIVDGSVMVA